MQGLKLKNINVAYYDKLILSDINLEIAKGTMCAITGPNGAGKSTLLKTILGLIKPLSGSITLDGKPINKDYNLISYVPQKESVNWQFPTTVYDVVLMGSYKQLGWFKKPTKHEHDKVKAALKALSIEDLKDEAISELSGGQQQRVFLARMLCQDAQYLFLDEPFVGIDKKSETIIVNLLKKLQNQGKTIIIVHHDLATIKQYFDHIVLVNHKIIATGAVSKVFTKENIDKTYGGNIDGFFN